MQNKRRSILLSLLRRELGHTQNEARITILPSLRLGCSNHSHLSFIRRGFYPIPRPFPSPGEGMQPLLLVALSLRFCSLNSGRREISYATELRLSVFAALTLDNNADDNYVISICYMASPAFTPTLLYGRRFSYL